MKTLDKKIVLFLLLAVTTVSAQIGVGTRTPHPDAMLEVATTNKGILLPRVALTATTAVAPLSAHVAGMTVYNTATAADVTPGYYYNDGSKWVKLATGQGVKGDTGASAYQSAVAGGYTGTEAQWLASLVGAAGKSAYEVWKATPDNTTKSEADYLASLKGEAGANGKSAYQIWKDAGNTGTESDFLIAIKGVAGTNGIEGKSAYQIWKDAGNTGTETDFLLAIKGPAGANGADGAVGPQGAPGANGKTVLNGTTDPVIGTGSDGDFYINTTSNTIFGPKAIGAWPATGTSLVGPSGSNASITGTAPIAVTSGVVSINDFGVNAAKLATDAVETDKIKDASVTVAKISATGTASSTTFLRGDGAWMDVATLTNISTTEVVLPIKIDGAQLYAIKGSFTADGVSAAVTIAKPTGMTGYYSLKTYKDGKTFRNQILSFSTTDTVGNVITGNDFLTEVYPSGSYNYVLEYFK